MSAIREIQNINDFHYCVGKIMYFCQCIEHDIKLVYKGMRKPMNDSEKAQFNAWTLGKTINELEKLDNSDGKPYFSNDDYDLLRTIKDIRNFYAHECYEEFIYESDDFKLNKAFSKVSRRLINDHNRLDKLFLIVEKVRLRFFGYQ